MPASPDVPDKTPSPVPFSTWKGAIRAKREDHRSLRVLAAIEYVLLYLTAFVLLVVGSLVLVLTVIDAVRNTGSLPERLISLIEELLLVLIIMEIFATVLASLRGARFMLEPFLLVGVIAVVRHILSLVVRLAVIQTPAEARIRLVELAVDAGVVLALVAAPGRRPQHREVSGAHQPRR